MSKPRKGRDSLYKKSNFPSDCLHWLVATILEKPRRSNRDSPTKTIFHSMRIPLGLQQGYRFVSSLLFSFSLMLIVDIIPLVLITVWRSSKSAVEPTSRLGIFIYSIEFYLVPVTIANWRPLRCLRALRIFDTDTSILSFLMGSPIYIMPY